MSTKKKNPNGRPKEYTDEWIDREADLFLAWMQKEDSIYFKTFAIERGYSPTRLAEFAEINKKFSGVYTIAKQWQECKLVNLGLFNKTNCGMTKFVLVNHHNWNEKQAEPTGAETLQALIESISGKSKDLVQDE